MTTTIIKNFADPKKSTTRKLVYYPSDKGVSCRWVFPEFPLPKACVELILFINNHGLNVYPQSLETLDVHAFRGRVKNLL